MNEMGCSLTINKQSEKIQKHPSLQKSTFKTMFELCPFNSKILDNWWLMLFNEVREVRNSCSR